MRSLSLASSRSWQFPVAKISSIAVDVDEDGVFVVSEKPNNNADVELEVFKVGRRSDNDDYPTPVAVFTVSGFQTHERSQVVSLRYLSDTQSLCLVTYDGDIGLVALGDDALAQSQFEVVGSIDSGIKAACWSPDDSSLAVVTGEGTLLLMTSSFDVLVEVPLQVSDSGEDQPVNVGWGSKQTQFHGSLGKAAAQTPQSSLDSIGASPDDDGLPRVSWRGDCAYFVVSSLEKSRYTTRARRMLRVYDRQGVLQNTSEPVAGLEHTLSWKPSGNLIAGAQRFGFEAGGAGTEGRHDVVFFERNGLRHGEFTLREAARSQAKELKSEGNWGYKVKELLWSSDSSILAVWMSMDEGDVVQLWTMNNYHWYLKQEVLAPPDEEGLRRFTSVQWHPESAFSLLLTTTTHLVERTFAWETIVSRCTPPDDTGSVAVVDGCKLLLTPFRAQNVPPPMSSLRLSLFGTAETPSTTSLHENRTPIHVCFTAGRDALAVLHHGGRIQLWLLETRIPSGETPNLGPAYEPRKLCDTALEVTDNGIEPRQICAWGLPSSNDDTADVAKFRIACLTTNANSDIVFVLDIVGADVVDATRVAIQGNHGRLVDSADSIYWQSRTGKIQSVSVEDGIVLPFIALPEFCFSVEASSTTESDILFVARSDSGKLYTASTTSSTCATLATNCTSFAVAAGFVIYTASSHEAFFAPLHALQKWLSTEPVDDDAKGGVSHHSISPHWEHRRVERGSRIVVVIPSTMSLVLQMPRGNLETINPRPLVMKVVNEDVDAGNFRNAFLTCRKHRIDFSVLVEHGPQKFRGRISEFVEQIDDVDFFNLFLTSLGQSNLPETEVSELCDAIRAELTSRSLTKYVHSILTAFVVKKPPDYESALSLLHKLRETNQDMVEDAVKYVIFLVDVDKLFDTALGMYDFALVLLIAQQSQRDPREYLPFLRELRALPKYYQQYKIDDHLKRHSSALKNLHLAGPEYFDEAVAYTEKHRLFNESLKLWSEDEEKYSRILDVYGDYLYERHEYRQAAILFVEAKRRKKAMIAYERALLWRELFELAIQVDENEPSPKTNDDAENELVKMAYRVAEELSSKKRHTEAAQVLLDYAHGVRNCVSALAHGNHFSEARRIIALHRVPELVEEMLHPAALDSRTQISEEIEEMRTQLQKQVGRLRELAERKITEPDAFYGTEDDPNLHNVDAMTDVSMPATAFTRYTAAPSNMSRSTSKRTSRSKRKMERKVGSGRKGTIDEEEYLLKSVAKLVTRFEGVQAEVSSLLPHLTQFSKGHREEARSLQAEMSVFADELQHAVEEIWAPPRDSDEEEPTSEFKTDSWAARMAETARRNERRDPRERVQKPVIGSSANVQASKSNLASDWKVGLLEI